MARATASRGRIDKREAILAAAFTVFARSGYDQACVQEIADEAGVAKPTVYNHLSDKETLFRHALTVAADAVMAENLAAADRLREVGPDLRAALADAGYRMLRVCCGEQARALRRLTCAQAATFPELSAAVQERTWQRLVEALSDRLARLALAGRLRPCDPALAAEQFLALLTAPMESRSHLGTRKLPLTETRAISTAATDTFLRAYAP